MACRNESHQRALRLAAGRTGLDEQCFGHHRDVAERCGEKLFPATQFKPGRPAAVHDHPKQPRRAGRDDKFRGHDGHEQRSVFLPRRRAAISLALIIASRENEWPGEPWHATGSDCRRLDHPHAGRQSLHESFAGQPDPFGEQGILRGQTGFEQELIEPGIGDGLPFNFQQAHSDVPVPSVVSLKSVT